MRAPFLDPKKCGSLPCTPDCHEEWPTTPLSTQGATCRSSGAHAATTSRMMAAARERWASVLLPGSRSFEACAASWHV